MSNATERLMISVLAEIHARNNPHTRIDSLVEMLMNPDFPPRDDTVAQDRHPETYNDVPSLEDEVTSSSDGHLPRQDIDPPPLEDHVRRSVSAPPSPIVDGSARRTNGTTRGAVRFEDGGAESDSSLPSLHSVSDSSYEGDDYLDDSESEWDEDDSLVGTEDEASIASIIEADAPRNADAAGPSTLTGPETSSTSSSEYPWQFRDLLERARGLIPVQANADVVQSQLDWISEMASHISSIDNDFQRADTLLAGMEVVPDALALRYEKLRSTDGEDLDGCAVCRDDLVDKSPNAQKAARLLEVLDLLPFHHETNSVVAFPCSGKHLFHRFCLSPWLARKTTCPTCRFDIDPHSLTLRIMSHDSTTVNMEAHTAQDVRVWRPPQVESMSEWLDAEEMAKNMGVPRERPAVVMPQYSAVPPTEMFGRGVAPPRPTRPEGAPLSEILQLEEALAWGLDPAIAGLQAMRDRIQAVRLRLNIDTDRHYPWPESMIPQPEPNYDSPTISPFVPTVAYAEATRRLETPSPSGMSSGRLPDWPTPSPPLHEPRIQEITNSREHPNLHSTPVSRDPPPNDVVIDAPINPDYRSREILRIHYESVGIERQLTNMRRQDMLTEVLAALTRRGENSTAPESVDTNVVPDPIPVPVRGTAIPAAPTSLLPSNASGNVSDWTITNPADDLD